MPVLICQTYLNDFTRFATHQDDWRERTELLELAAWLGDAMNRLEQARVVRDWDGLVASARASARVGLRKGEQPKAHDVATHLRWLMEALLLKHNLY